MRAAAWNKKRVEHARLQGVASHAWVSTDLADMLNARYPRFTTYQTYLMDIRLRPLRALEAA